MLADYFEKMGRRAVILFSVCLLWTGISLAGPCFPRQKEIVILYDNDVHCNLESYTCMSALRNEMIEKTPFVSIVSSGDFLSGSAYGSVSRGAYAVRMMNAVGYDFVTLGNHEFDFTLPVLEQRMSELKAEVLSCNFCRTADRVPVYKAYAIRRYGKIRVAFVGVTTPDAVSSSTPSYFCDSAGRYLYSFQGKNLAACVQHQVDAARAEGADYVLLLSHVGLDNNESVRLIASTTGIDAVLDGHSHSVIPGSYYPDLSGKPVLLTSTGSHFSHIGKLCIAADGRLSSELLRVSELTKADSSVSREWEMIKADFETVASRVVGRSLTDMPAEGADGSRPVRNQECILGDFCADAFRAVLGTDVAFVNGGGLRAGIMAGTLRFQHLYAVFPYNNKVSVLSVSGRTLQDVLEHSCQFLPEEFGGFLQVSGLKFTVDTSVHSSVETDSNGIFLCASGARRVSGVEVFDARKGNYEPLDTARTYTVASIDYLLMEKGNGYVFENASAERLSVCSDVEVLERYIVEYLHGIIGLNEAAPQGRITILSR